MRTNEAMANGTDAPADHADKPEGPVAAAILAGGIGCLSLGVFTTLAEMSGKVKDFLAWSAAVGPLSGKTGMAVIVWIASWVILHLAFRNKELESRRALTIALVLVGIGVVGTFPTFFEAFAPE